MSKNHAEIGNRLKSFCDKNFPSRKDFAAALDMSYEALTNYITGQVRPGNKLQQKLRDLGCDIEWLMTGSKKAAGVSEPIAQFDMPGHLTKEQGERYKKLLAEIKKVSSDDPEAIEKMLILTQTIFKKKK